VSVTADAAAADRLYGLAAAQGYAQASIELSERITGPPVDMQGWQRRCRILASQCTAPELLHLAVIHSERNPSMETAAAMMCYLREAARLGHHDAYPDLGYSYMSGLSGTADPAAAWRVWRSGALHGNTWSLCRLGAAYHSGEGVVADPVEGTRLTRLSAELGNPAAQYSLGLSYYHGTGVPQDRAAAVSWWHRAAEAGHSTAQHNLAACYQAGLGVAQDHAAASHWYGLAHHVPSMAVIRVRHIDASVPADAVPAVVAAARVAAEQGDAAAQMLVAVAMLTGLGAEVDLPGSVRLLRMASAQGHAEAQMLLGLCCVAGRGTAVDLEEGRRWLEAAAAQGSAEAVAILIALARPGRVVE
jgi:TPR repeat protein